MVNTYQCRINVRYVNELLVNLMHSFVLNSALLEIGVRKIQQHIFRQKCIGSPFEHCGSLVAQIFRRINVTFLCENLRAKFEKMSGLVPDSRMMTEAQQALLNRKHDSTSDQRRVFGSQRIATLPSDIFFPQFDLEIIQHTT